MNKNNKIVLLVVCIVSLMAFVIYWYVKNYTPKYRWTENYICKNDQPYGLKLFYDLLSNTHAKGKFILMETSPKDFLEKEDSSALYLFVGAKFITDSMSLEALGNFVKRGNNAFIASSESEHGFFKTFTNDIHPVVYYQTFEDSIIKVAFDTIAASRYTFDFKNGKKLALHEWQGMDSVYFKDSLSYFGFEKITTVKRNRIDCFRVKYGKGWFIFQFNPILFTNYNLSKPVGYEYINRLFSPYNKPRIVWDEYSKTDIKNNSSSRTHASPLRFILSEKSLRWAWYSLCILVLLFLIFNSKRKQAFIPLLPDNNNTTIEYINSLAILHYQNNSAEFLADEILKQFQSFIKHKYGVSQNLKKNEIAHVLAPLSGIPEDILNVMFKHYMGVKYSQMVENKDLLEFYRLTEYFYQNCK